MPATFLAYAKDPAIRAMASSGGCTKALLACLLDFGFVHGVVAARTGDGRRFAPEAFVVTNKAELLTPRTNSVYYPVDPFTIIPERLDPAKRYAATLLPCQVRRLRAMQAQGRARNVVLVVELLCNYVPQPAWTQQLCQAVGVPEPTTVTYRGNGWPGEVIAQDDLRCGAQQLVTAWSPDVDRYGDLRCRGCSLICGGADMTVLDPWCVPPEAVGTGKTVVQVHNEAALACLHMAAATRCLVLEPQPGTLFKQHAAPLAKAKRARRDRAPQDVLVWYWRGGDPVLNFGEHFTELLLAKLGYRARSFDVARAAGTIRRTDPAFLIIGSEFHHGIVDPLLACVDHVHVWGQGNGRRDEHTPIDMQQPDLAERITIHALRGPLTKERSNFAGNVPLLDPGFLMPRLYPLRATREAGVLFIPHHENTAQAARHLAVLQADACLDVMISQTEILATMQRIVQARFALVNSLHALIFCLAYRVPCAVALMPGEMLNMPDKWLDVIRSLGGTPQDFVTVQSLPAGMDWWEKIGQHLAIPDSRELLEVFPLPRKVSP